MVRNPASRRPSRVAFLLVAGLLAALVAAPGTVAAAGGMTISEAELAMVDALNADRTALGLVPVQIDSRLMAIAHARSVDMATNHYFSHYKADRFVYVDMLNAQGIAWYGAGEIIAANSDATLEQSFPHANTQWLNSPPHFDIVVSRNYNYIGVGVAYDSLSHTWKWTAVYLDGPDRTGATATAKKPTVAPSTITGKKRVTVNWTGVDVLLQVRTSGLHSFRVQQRVDDGGWATIVASTTAKTLAVDLAGGHTYRFRVSARDVAGNWGAWSTAKTTLPASVGAVIIPTR